jgi:hypothetical protein
MGTVTPAIVPRAGAVRGALLRLTRYVQITMCSAADERYNTNTKIGWE